ncbi:nicotinamide mononucleotide transporter PnuC family protein [Rhodococcus sp. MTM3W5.2]|uniref:nicotinamide riboside transporter PnuC n=1 Tax=Rhodococcus sp. MTM3W5.2 TaxID=1805827 RepID=UPI0009797C45|nr:nicotinamide riboside transporter PnuC [Rhodococcus sp. MTM3W5.2]AQA23498.1 nicotinamide mononucleotide transporter PnuC family protein [Rhodococcus sp. MTM3W5.2]
MNPLLTLFDAELHIGGATILWREIVGNTFGIASAIGGMKRVVWAWPVGIAGNALLFTVFMGALFHTPQELNLYGQAGRQLMFISVSVYGWTQWVRSRHESGQAVQPRWAPPRDRLLLVLAMAAGTVAFAQIFARLGSYGPWAEAWIFMGSMLATYGMARGWTEFWLIWIAVDVVGVPLLLKAGYYPSAILYLVYAGFVVWGFAVWLRIQRRTTPVRV